MQVETKDDVYLVTDCIQVQSFFKVYHCQSVHTHTRCRVKEIQKSGIPREITQQQVDFEIQIWKTVNHPQIPKLIEIHESEDAYIIVTEFFSTDSLYPLTAPGNYISENRARSIFKQILDLLEYLHSEHIFLRNLRPENILIDGREKIAISDFGFAILCAPTDLLSDFFGVTLFSAPEMLEKVEYCGPAVDVWSLGMTLYCLLSEKEPWSAPDSTQLFYAILTDPLPRQPKMGFSVFTLLQQMLIRDVRQRFSLSQVKQHYWFTSAEQNSGCGSNLMNMFGRILTLKSAEKETTTAVLSGRDRQGQGKLLDELEVKPQPGSVTTRRKAADRKPRKRS